MVDSEVDLIINFPSLANESDVNDSTLVSLTVNGIFTVSTTTWMHEIGGDRFNARARDARSQLLSVQLQ